MDNRKLLTELFTDDVELIDESLLLAGTILGGVKVAEVLYILWRTNKKKHEKYRIKCNLKEGKERKKCIIKSDISFYKTNISIIKRNMANKKCNDKCQEKSKKSISKLEIKIKKLEEKLKQLD